MSECNHPGTMSWTCRGVEAFHCSRCDTLFLGSRWDAESVVPARIVPEAYVRAVDDLVEFVMEMKDLDVNEDINGTEIPDRIIAAVDAVIAARGEGEK